MIYAVNAITANAGDKNVQSVSSSTDFSSFLEETQSLDSIFQKAADTYQVPANLLKAIGKQESDFNPNAVSKCGAQGIMQLMPATAASLGVTNALDAEQNIMGGAKYIAELLQKYEGNVSYALAAYNAGSNNVAKYGGIPPFKETQNYVVKVQNYMNQGIEIPNMSFSFASDAINQTAENTTKSINSIGSFSFTYEDYLEFILLFEKIVASYSEKEDTTVDQAEQKGYVQSLYENSKLPSLSLANMLDLSST